MFPGNVVRFDTLSNTYDIKYCDGWEESGVASNHVMARVLPSVQEKRAATMAAKAAAAAAKKAAAEGTAWHAAPPHPRVRREVYVGDAYREALDQNRANSGRFWQILAKSGPESAKLYFPKGQVSGGSGAGLSSSPTCFRPKTLYLGTTRRPGGQVSLAGSLYFRSF